MARVNEREVAFVLVTLSIMSCVESPEETPFERISEEVSEEAISAMRASWKSLRPSKPSFLTRRTKVEEETPEAAAILRADILTHERSWV